MATSTSAVPGISSVALRGATFQMRTILAPLFLQQARGYGAFDTGLLLLPQAIAAAVTMPLGGRLFDRIGARPLVVAGLALIAAAMALLSQVSATTQGADLIVPLALSGAGMGLMLMTLQTYLMTASPRELVSRVTALTNALRQVATSLAIAGLATILTSRATMHLTAAKLAFATRPARPAGATGAPPHDVVAHVAHELHAALSSAFVAAFGDTFRVLCVAAVAGAVLGLALRRPRAVPAEGADEGAISEAAHAGGPWEAGAVA